jgi:pseudaminic acid synthase
MLSVELSDHSMGSLAAVAVVAMRAQVIEKHFCLSRKIKSPNSSFSMKPNEFRQIVNNIRIVEKEKGIVSYGTTKEKESNIAFRRSIFVVKDIRKDEIITKKNIGTIRPGEGLKPKYIKNVLGRKAKDNIKSGTPLNFWVLSG